MSDRGEARRERRLDAADEMLNRPAPDESNPERLAVFYDNKAWAWGVVFDDLLAMGKPHDARNADMFYGECVREARRLRRGES
jgi:hypothetical protein